MNRDVKPLVACGVNPAGTLDLVYQGVIPTKGGSVEILNTDSGLRILGGDLVDPQGPFRFDDP